MRYLQVIFGLLFFSVSIYTQVYKDQNGNSFIISSDPFGNVPTSTLALPATLDSSFTITLPSDYGTNGQYLQFNSGITSWQSVTSSSAADGNTGNIQLKNGSSLLGVDDLFWDISNKRLGIGTSTPSYTMQIPNWLQLGANGFDGQVYLYSETGGANDYTISFIANTNSTENVTIKFPEGNGSTDEILVSDGSGQLFWVTQNTVIGSFPCDEGQGTGGGSGNTAAGQHSFVGGGTGNSANSNATGAFIGAGTANTVEGDRSAIIVGGSNYIGPSADQSVIGAGTNDTILGDDSMIAAGSFNYLGADAHRTAIGSGYSNRVLDINSGISAGEYNTISTTSTESFIGGGSNNSMSNADESVIIAGDSSTVSGNQSVVASGLMNTVSSNRSVIGSGRYNSVSGNNSSIAAGDSNSVSGQNSVILGGIANTVSGNNSMSFGYSSSSTANYTISLGRRASAQDQGSFVFTDQTDATLTSSATNRYHMRFSNGYRFYTNAALTSGAQIGSSGSSWSSISDINAKENIKPLDNDYNYNAIIGLPVYSWSYTHTSPEERHFGPMAQDYFPLFGFDGLGYTSDSLRISNVHLVSLSISALQGYSQLSQELSGEIETEKEKQKKLLERLKHLEERLDSIEMKGDR